MHENVLLFRSEIHNALSVSPSHINVALNNSFLPLSHVLGCAFFTYFDKGMQYFFYASTTGVCGACSSQNCPITTNCSMLWLWCLLVDRVLSHILSGTPNAKVLGFFFCGGGALRKF
jgi:long-subunit acyl-CoA synthetase (AMP-forming)